MVRWSVMASMDHPNRACGSTSDGDWRRELTEAVRDGTELARRLGLPDDVAAPSGDWPVLVPRPYLARIKPGDPRDPLLLQVLPQSEESLCPAGFSTDPLDEAAEAAIPGLLAKYQGRSLIVTTGQCAVHCRFCFRRHFPFAEAPLSSGGNTPETEPRDSTSGPNASLTEPRASANGPCRDNAGPSSHSHAPALAQIAADPTIHEAILSGGDPLMLDDEPLADLIRRLAQIDHLRRVRVHTRLPVVVPSRVTPSLVGLLRATRLSPRVVVHVNHPAEIDAAVARSFARLIDAGIPVMSQSVLLRGVNDDIETLAALFERLIDLRVMPYYLHQLDRVAGAAHFEVDESRGRELIDALRARLPGYAVPRYVREIPGNPYKSPLTRIVHDTHTNPKRKREVCNDLSSTTASADTSRTGAKSRAIE